MKRGYLDSPAPGAAFYGSCISIAGWVYAEEDAAADIRIRAWIDQDLTGETSLLFVRDDICAALNLPAGTATGFRILSSIKDRGDETYPAEIRVVASWNEQEESFEIGQSTIQLYPARLQPRPHGGVIHPQQERLLHREDIYGSGPPVEEANAAVLTLIEQYLPAGSSVLDVGCGAGAYGPPLRAAAYEWLGVEVNARCCELLAKRELPFRKSETGRALPVRDLKFDHAICIEVIEHIEEVDFFLSEIARSIRGRALFSVPNIEVVPYFSAWQVVPWHLLEADHKNFFTRASFRGLLQKHFGRVEVFSYAEHPLRTPEGLALDAHLFAIAEKA